MWVWQAFQLLSECRDFIDGIPQRIKVSEIESYCNMFSIYDGDERADLVGKVVELDRAYTNHMIAERQKEASKAARDNKRRAPRGR